MGRIGAILVMMGVLLGGALVGADAADWRTPLPKVPAKGEKCVRDTPFMRSNHMELLLHQRDDAVHQGLRPKQTALNECLTCHAVPGADSKPVTYKDPKHFCRACHDYVAVSVDCFSCHNSAPDASEVAKK
jgi:predicted CXXCH cytochrome family protein